MRKFANDNPNVNCIVVDFHPTEAIEKIEVAYGLVKDGMRGGGVALCSAPPPFDL